MVEMPNELVCLAGLQLVEQLLHVPLHLGEFLDERGAVHYRVISRYGSAIQATYWRGKKTAFVAPRRRLGRRKHNQRAEIVVVWLAAYRTAFLHVGRLAPVGAERQFRDGIEPV